MGHLLLKQCSSFVITLLGVSLLTFTLVRLIPGDPVLLMLGERGGTQEQYEAMKKKWGLDRPLYQQYFVFVGKALKGDLGRSTQTQRPVAQEFFDRFPATLELGLCALFWAALVGIPFGIMAAVKHNGPFDYFVMGVSLVGYSMPVFWWALILIIFFSVQAGLTPVAGRIHLLFDIPPVTGFLLVDTLVQGHWPAFVSALRHLLLPALVIGTIPLAVIARITRSSMLEIIHKDYMRTAKAKGLTKGRILVFHALTNALIPIVTVIGLQFGGLLTGAILTETIFSWPGIGKWMALSVTQRDYPVIQGSVLIMAALIVLVNTCVDIISTLINPQLRR